MDKTIFVYSDEKITDLKVFFPDRVFVGFAYLFNFAPSIEDINTLDDKFKNYVVDVSSLALENGYYKFFMERYLYLLMDKFNDMVFIVLGDQKQNFVERFPFLFDHVNEYYLTLSDSNALSDQETPHNKINFTQYIPLSLYSKDLLERCIENYKIVSIGNLFEGAENLNYKLNIDDLLSSLGTQEIDYIDITSVVELFRVRGDLILYFEILLRKIFALKDNIKFLICDEKLEDIKRFLPFTFKTDKILHTNQDNTIHNTKDSFNNVQIESIMAKINERLKGHEKFKKDFGFNLQKYIFLSELGERKIFSVFLTGESGIGKTEFAKILSEIMYQGQELIKINFGNYSNEGVLNSLIGSPLGYIGSEEGGELINKIHVSKSRVILIDEFEKATPSVFHFFYELLEDGKFTDRHGVEHNLDGYIIIFTSNMTKKRYIESIPNPLKSRFDLVYCFVELPPDDKKEFVIRTATKLIDKIYEHSQVQVQLGCVEQEMDNLIKNNNLRNIKRKIEDIVIAQYFTLTFFPKHL